MLEFRPTIVRDDQTVEFPRPILVCRIHDSWDFLKFKVPRRDGDQIAGRSRDGVDITIEGQVGSHAGELTLTEETMLETLIALRTALHVTSDDGFLLSLYQDGEEDFRHFRKCTTSRFDIDLSNQRIYSYAAVIHAADPTLYSGLLP